jgi:S1-C subfamily serine protease
MNDEPEMSEQPEWSERAEPAGAHAEPPFTPELPWTGWSPSESVTEAGTGGGEGRPTLPFYGSGYSDHGFWVQGPPPPWAPVAPPRRRRRGLVAAAIAAAAIVGVGVGLGAGNVVDRGGSGGSSQTANGPGSAPISTGEGNSTDDGNSSSIASKVEPGIVDINTKLGYQNAAAAGTGMVLTSKGEVLTNNHVIDGATSIAATVVTTGRTYTAKVVGTDPSDDVAVLQLQGASGLKTVQTANSSKVAEGDSVVAIGNAGGAGGTPTVVTGTIVALGQSITASDQGGGNAEQLTGLIESNAPIEAGDSGGPLVNSAGKVIGMNSAASTGSRFDSTANEAYAIPINHALSIARQIESGHGSSTVEIGARGYLGIQVQASGSQGGSGFGNGSGFGFGDNGSGGSTTSGAVVSGTVSGSPAEAAGIEAGDVITSVNGKTVNAPDDLTSALRGHHPGDKVTIGWTDQSGQSHTATITLTTGPAD